ncbi:MAG: RNA polymerase sigma factor [Solirubrobacteraceae bacterium]
MPALDPRSLPGHTDRLYRAAWALCGSPDDAQDLVQETFARVLARPRLLRGGDERAYLMQVLRNTFLTQRRTASRRPQISTTTLEQFDPVDPRVADRPEEALQTHEVFATIATLSEDHRLALVAVDVVGLSYREAARARGTREATIATRVFRARERMARELSSEEPAPADAQSARDGDSRDGKRATDERIAMAEGPHSNGVGAPEAGASGVGTTATGASAQGAAREGNGLRRSLIQ